MRTLVTLPLTLRTVQSSLMTPTEPLHEGVRKAAVLFALEDFTVVVNTLTLAALRVLARVLAAAALRRRTRRPAPAEVTLIVKGPSLNLHVRLPAEVRSSEILDCLRPLLRDAR